MAEQKKYWIKLEKDFLNSSQIKVIKNMQNGKDYIIFYLALMLESTNTEGHLRFNELVPYNEEMLASVTDTNVDIVRSAIKIFESLGLIQFLENGTIFLPDVPKRVGKESESAERVRLYRERTKMLQCNDNVTNCNDNKDKDKDKKKEPKAPPKISFAEFVTLTQIEFDTLAKELGSEFIVEDCIEILDNYKGSSGKKYKSDYRAIKSWVIDKYKEKHKEGGQRGQSTSNNGQNVFKDEDLPNQIIL